MRPTVSAFTRTLGAHSIAAVMVKFTNPAFAAPYAADMGDGRMPLTLLMLTIEPPSPSCIQWLARCEQKIAAKRLRAMTRSVNRGGDVVVSAGGPPPALL